MYGKGGRSDLSCDSKISWSTFGVLLQLAHHLAARLKHTRCGQSSKRAWRTVDQARLLVDRAPASLRAVHQFPVFFASSAVGRSNRYEAVLPASTTMDCPVRKGASQAKNTMVSAISSGVAARLTGTVSRKFALPSPPPVKRLSILKGVAIGFHIKFCRIARILRWSLGESHDARLHG